MKYNDQKIVTRENYMKRNKIGEDLLLKNQVLINLDTEQWITLSFKSNIFYKITKLEFYHPERFVNITIMDIKK
ncbi:hypothetical protein [uncultured Clostridium sp.]|uniref:hypothetical protein n=1 Tax=uncultured Clostridium sp. TaxID=59620 RepID=UPI0025CFD68F|nr:hypothetical protein [uncultured Clostridium sp.]